MRISIAHIWLMICLVSAPGCSTRINANAEDYSEIESRTNFVPVYRFGIDCYDISTGCQINDLVPESPAAQSGMQIGDVIVAINGGKSSNKDLLSHAHFSGGQATTFKLSRNGQELSLNIKPKRVAMVPPSVYKIYELLNLGEKNMALVVYISDVKNNTDFLNKSAWEASERMGLQSFLEASMIKSFEKNSRFSLIDRVRLDRILDEHKINMTGLISDTARSQIGKLTGATHLLSASLSRYPKSRNSCNDIMTARLIEIETGQVLAIDQRNTDCE